MRFYCSLLTFGGWNNGGGINAFQATDDGSQMACWAAGGMNAQPGLPHKQDVGMATLLFWNQVMRNLLGAERMFPNTMSRRRYPLT